MNGKSMNLSIIVNRYLSLVLDENFPLEILGKPLIWLHGFYYCSRDRSINLGFSSAHIQQFLIVSFISSMKKGRFLIHFKSSILVMPR